MCETCNKAQQILQKWLDKQGHNRCWYYPDLFHKLADLLEVKASVEPKLPTRHEFEIGCKRYQEEQFDAPPVWACSHWGFYEHDWLDCEQCLDSYEKWLEEDNQNNAPRHGNNNLDTVCNYQQDFEAPGC